VTDQPLAGQRVVVTRAEHQAGGLAAALAAAGATVELLPLLAILPPPDPAPLAAAVARLHANAWVVFTSSNAVDAVLPLLAGAWPRSVQVAAIGPATALALGRHGVVPTLVARQSQAEGVLAELVPRLPAGARVLLPQAADARPVLRDGLLAVGVAVEPVVAYGKGLPDRATDRAAALFGDSRRSRRLDGAEDVALRALGWVTFTSPSLARAFADLFGSAWAERRGSLLAASIGSLTTQALAALGVEPAAEAQRPTDLDLAAAVVAAAAGGVS
jgi:uroporphyrinogen-III synthase